MNGKKKPTQQDNNPKFSDLWEQRREKQVIDKGSEIRIALGFFNSKMSN